MSGNLLQDILPHAFGFCNYSSSGVCHIRYIIVSVRCAYVAILQQCPRCRVRHLISHTRTDRGRHPACCRNRFNSPLKLFSFGAFVSVRCGRCRQGRRLRSSSLCEDNVNHCLPWIRFSINFTSRKSFSLPRDFFMASRPPTKIQQYVFAKGTPESINKFPVFLFALLRETILELEQEIDEKVIEKLYQLPTSVLK